MCYENILFGKIVALEFPQINSKVENSGYIYKNLNLFKYLIQKKLLDSLSTHMNKNSTVKI